MSDCTIVILTYKGKHHLEFLLPTVKVAVNNYKGLDKLSVLIVDNSCEESTKKWVLDSYPDFDYQFSPKNDYLFSLNSFMANIKTEFVFLLNDDIRLTPDIMNQLVPVMEADPTLFGAACKIRDWDDTYTASAVRSANYNKGWLYNTYLDFAEERTMYTLNPSGGAGIFRTKFFNELNGFDPLYRPAYCEDLDLGIKAWQSGWKIIYHPKAVLFHREGGTIKEQFKKDKLTQNIARNQILWMFKNVRYPGFMFWFIALLPYRMIRNALSNKNHYIAFINAIPLFPEAYKKRKRFVVKVNDEHWLPLINTEYKQQA